MIEEHNYEERDIELLRETDSVLYKITTFGDTKIPLYEDDINIINGQTRNSFYRSYHTFAYAETKL